MPFPTDGRPLALVAHAALTTARDGVRDLLAPDGPLVRVATQVAQFGANAYDVISVATWALLLCLVARRSRGSLTRDLFGVVLAVAALTGS
jgi:hypothetical protein